VNTADIPAMCHHDIRQDGDDWSFMGAIGLHAKLL